MRAQLTDSALMKQVQGGGRTALGELYGRLSPRAYRTAFSICHDRDCSQDAVQDAFLSMWTSSSTYKASRGPVAGWAMSIVRHRTIYLAHQQSLTSERAAALARRDEESANDYRTTDLARSAERQELEESLLRLPSAQQEVIRLGFFEELSHQEIAHQLALPPGTVKGRMRLGLNKLRSELDP